MSNKKQLSINLTANVIAYTTNIIISFFLTPYLIKVLGKEAYSFYPMANNFVSYMSIVTVALNSMASRFITIEITKNNIERANIYFSSVFYANIILSVILFIPMSCIVILLDKILNIPIDLVSNIKILFALVFISMIINIITSIFSIAVYAKNRMDLKSIVDIAYSILKVFLYVGMFLIFEPDIMYVGIISIILSIVTYLMHRHYTKRLLPEMVISTKYFEIQSIKKILSSGVWNSVNQIGSSLMFSLAIVYCNVLVGPSAGGEYSIVQTIPNFVNGIISTLTAVFVPSITQTYAVKKIDDVIEDVKESQKIMGMITNIPIVVFMVIGVDFYRLWVPTENAMRLHILSILTIFHLLFVGVTWTVQNLNTVINKVKIPALYMVGSGIVNFILVILLTSFTSLGVYAIPIASVIILIIWAAFFIPIYPCIELKLKWTTFYEAICRMLFSSSIIYAFTFMIRKIFNISSWFSLIGFCVIGASIGFIVNWFIVLNNNDKKNILLMLSKIKQKKGKK